MDNAIHLQLGSDYLILISMIIDFHKFPELFRNLGLNFNLSMRQQNFSGNGIRPENFSGNRIRCKNFNGS